MCSNFHDFGIFRLVWVNKFTRNFGCIMKIILEALAHKMNSTQKCSVMHLENVNNVDIIM